ncbi:hypothetical protein HPP92_024057 [Vanilla planifolia]|uniref:Uncharacterized protein n=1 Tax=Vanilla planifolia TaxID=51239 RepID=A0A835PJN9_VANPL|nr:hypothetical protein HPP92_024442 [Vanilla planifolia]KAG0456269.1 hypothetical protein HPP92_024057 [Vanilla planifolia]
MWRLLTRALGLIQSFFDLLIADYSCFRAEAAEDRTRVEDLCSRQMVSAHLFRMDPFFLGATFGKLSIDADV